MELWTGAPASQSRRRFIKQSSASLTALFLPTVKRDNNEHNPVTMEKFDVITIGGSYAGLAAGMALGRALKNVLIIDSGKPCNRYTPHSHNFITHDGRAPGEIAALAKQQVAQYSTVKFLDGLAVRGEKNGNVFHITTEANATFAATKLIFATGVRDLMPDIGGFEACWGKSVIHCPYCHGYEVRNECTGILGNGDYAFEFGSLISNWTSDLTIYTNGKSTLTEEQVRKLAGHNIGVVENEIDRLEHSNGALERIVFRDDKSTALRALYTRPAFVQHCDIPASLGCALSPEGYVKVDSAQNATIAGVYACGDNTTKMRTVANAVAMGTTAGMMVNKELALEGF